MSFTISDANLPAILTAEPMTDEEFTAFCAEHPDLDFEMTAEGEIIVMAPTHFLIGASGSEVSGQLRNWARIDGRGVSCDSSTGFVLPNGARRSPDASWTLKSRIRAIDAQRRRSFLHLCPDFVTEVRSDSDRLRPLQRKMREYIENGAQLGWLIDIQSRSVEIYRPEGGIETRTSINSVAGDGPVAGFVLDLTLVWDPLGE
jgi:Uma2 family endonuclease